MKPNAKFEIPSTTKATVVEFLSYVPQAQVSYFNEDRNMKV